MKHLEDSDKKARLSELTRNLSERQTVIRISSPVPKRVSTVPVRLKPQAV
jgi:hypothetical protein